MDNSNENLLNLNNIRNFILEEGYTLIGDEFFPSAVPRSAPVKLKEYIAAAQKAYWGGFKSIDYVYKTYIKGNFIEKTANESKLLFEIVGEVRKMIDYAMGLISRNLDMDVPDTAGFTAAAVALSRLGVSINSACFLCENGLLFEPMNIAKLILEQSSWAYSVRNKELESIKKSAASKSITNLERIIPGVGKLYGRINEIAYLNAKMHFTRTMMDKDRVLLSSQSLGTEAAYILYRVVEVYCAILEWLYLERMGKTLFIRKDGKGIKTSRKSAKVLKKIQTKLNLTNIMA